MARQQEPEAVRPARAAHPTIATIAAHMGLSRATVTHVLNGRAAEQRIRPETQRRVLEVARELGYRANASARAIRAGRFGNIALIQSLVGQYFPGELLLGLTKAIAAKDLHLVLTQVSDVDIDDAAYFPRALRELSADGVLINRHVGLSLPFLERIHKLHLPAIFLNVRQDFDCIHPDDLQGGVMATEFLLGLGHERVAYVGTEETEASHYSTFDRRAGYTQVMMAAGKTPRLFMLPQAWESPGNGGGDQRVEVAQGLLANGDRPTAIVAYELAEAMAIVHAAYLLGLRIPDDLSVVVFHNRVDDRYFLPFQTVSNAMEDVGAGAVGLLLEKIAHPDVALPAQVVPVALLEGATCAPPGKNWL